jgi:hypothetical protein
LPFGKSEIFFISGLDTTSENPKVSCPGFAKATPGGRRAVLSLSNVIARSKPGKWSAPDLPPEK